MRIVLDTNCLIQSVGRHSEFRPIWDSILNGQHTLCVTNEILEESSEILGCLFNQQFADMVILAILKNPFVELFSPHYRFNLISADPDDNKFVDCAIVANARYIVTNDHHYNVLRNIKFPSVDVMNLTDFLDLLRNSSF